MKSINAPLDELRQIHPGPTVAVVACYLPQFHPIPENNEWWGNGFTEWTNVAKAQPLFPSHRQPVQPGQLGFYDLRVAESQIAQSAMAEKAGISAFSYWHYWFGGRLVLERPSEAMLGNPDITIPFYFAWANESWTGHWHGAAKSMLLEQTYPGHDDDAEHFAYLEPFFHDPRHFRIDGRVVFSIYKPAAHPYLEQMMSHWNEMAERSGLGSIYWLAQCDAADDWKKLSAAFDRVYLNPQAHWSPLFGVPGRLLHALRMPRILDGAKTADRLAASLDERPELAPCVLPAWDNTPRSGRKGWVMIRATKEAFARQLDVAFAHERARAKRTGTIGVIVVKSWNEWAEGNCLEPGGFWGDGYLEVLAERTRL